MSLYKSPEVSIIIPGYNASAYIGRCLESLQVQSFQEMEIIFVDDGSTDNTKAVVEGFIQRDSRIRYVYQCNKGISVARNKGMAMARGAYLIFVDADDFVAKDIVRILLAPLAKSDYDIVVGNLAYHVFDKVHIHKNLSFTEDTELTQADFLRLQVTAQTKLYKKEFLLNNNVSFLEGCTEYEDVLFWYRLATLPVRSVYTPKVVYHYIFNPYSNSQYYYGEKMDNRFRALRYLLEEITFKYYRKNPYLLPHSLARLFKVIELSIGIKIKRDRKAIIKKLLPFMKASVIRFKEAGIIKKYSGLYAYALNNKVRAALLLYHFVSLLSIVSNRLACVFLITVSLFYRLFIGILRIIGGGGDFYLK